MLNNNMQLDLDTVQTLQILEDKLAELEQEYAVYITKKAQYEGKIELAKESIIKMITEALQNNSNLLVDIETSNYHFDRHEVRVRILPTVTNQSHGLEYFGIPEIERPHNYGLESDISNLRNAVAQLRLHRGATIKSKVLGNIARFLT